MSAPIGRSGGQSGGGTRFMLATARGGLRAVYRAGDPHLDDCGARTGDTTKLVFDLPLFAKIDDESS
ncbi:hypothetical protein AB0H43_21880 [Hamadaea sp. NPDC050747]|uniref:hypothetical protein n=1 Tax=Hamadaea sp. NPDC050747 TaxID=3155789 RepID=UPI00340DA53F